MTDYIQEMAAIVCVFDSGEIQIVSTHTTGHEARDELSRMREAGEDREWAGARLVVMDGGICHAHVDIEGLRARLDALENLA